MSGCSSPHLPPPRGQRKSVLRGPGPRSALLSSSAVLSREVKMFAIIATAALLVLAANAEAAAINYNHESRDTHDSDGPYEHKRGFYYLDLHGKNINDDSSWNPSWSSFRDAHPAEPSSTPPRPAYKEYHVPQTANKYNGLHGTVMKRDTTPKIAKIYKPTTYTRRKRSVRSVQSRPTHKLSYRRRQKRSIGDGEETLMRLADALALVTHSLLGQAGVDGETHPRPTEKPAQEQEEPDQKQEEPEVTVEDEPEEDEEVDPDVKHEGHDHDEEEEEFKDEDDEVDSDGEVESDVKHHDDEDEEEEFKDDEVDPDDEVESDVKHEGHDHDEDDEGEEFKDDEVDHDANDEVDEDEVDPKDDEVDDDDDEDEVDTKDDDEEDPEEDAKKPEKKSRKSKKKSKKQKKSKPKMEPEDHDMDTMDSDMDYYDADGYSDYTSSRRRYRSPSYRYKRSAGFTRMNPDMDYYGYDGYPDYIHDQSRKYRLSRKPRPSYMPSFKHHPRGKRSAGSSRSQLKYRMSQEARFRRMQSTAGQKRKNKHMMVKKYYHM